MTPKCPHCKVAALPYGAVWHCPRCGTEWPRQPLAIPKPDPQPITFDPGWVLAHFICSGPSGPMYINHTFDVLIQPRAVPNFCPFCGPGTTIQCTNITNVYVRA